MIIQVQKDLNFASGKKQLAIDLRVGEGTFLAITGPSGSGKTTLLRILAGLDNAKGKIIVQDTTWLDTSKNINRSPQKRKVGLVFQQYTLFPNMTVRQNLEYALEKNQSKSRVGELIELMELTAFAHQRPFHLSGGQQQRVALAQALVRRPTLLLLDEPLSALDDTLRSRLQAYILKIHQQFQLTTILVSHDLGEIFKMADKVIILKEGTVEKVGTPAAIYFNKKPSNMQLIGKVLSIDREESSVQAVVKVGEQIFRLPLSDDLLSVIRVGETLLLSSDSLKISRKI